MHLQPSPRQRELIEIGRRLARERFVPRAERHDREASFPFDDYADLHREGLLGLCVPERYGGSGRVSKPIAWWRSSWLRAMPRRR